MKVEKEEVMTRLNEGQAVLLNVQSKGDYKKLHIKGSENHPMTDDPKAFSEEVKQKYGKEKLFITYGERFGLLESFMATQALNENGCKAVNYAGGLREWHRAGMPVEGTEAGILTTPSKAL